MKGTWIQIVRVAISVGGVAVLGVAGVTAQAQDAGVALYKTKCAACHGADGKGDTAVGKDEQNTRSRLRRSAGAERRRPDHHHHQWKGQDAGLRKEPKAGTGERSGRVHPVRSRRNKH